MTRRWNALALTPLWLFVACGNGDTHFDNGTAPNDDPLFCATPPCDDGFDDGQGGAHGGDANACTTRADCPDGYTCSEGGCIEICAEQTEIAAGAPAQMLLVMDRSCSMKQGDGALGASKWEIAVDAVAQMMGEKDGKVDMALELFPATDACGAETVNVPFGPNSSSEITALLYAGLDEEHPVYPNGPCKTPIDIAMTVAHDWPALKSATQNSYVVLLTDGQQVGCGNWGGINHAENMITELAAAGTPTFVIGFGSNVGKSQLNKLAEAGGVTSNDPEVSYYRAEDAASLGSVFDSVVDQVVSCTFDVTIDSTDVSLLHVYVDDVEIPFDADRTDGWNFVSEDRIQLYGTACSSLTGDPTEVAVVNECPPPITVPVPIK